MFVFRVLVDLNIHPWQETVRNDRRPLYSIVPQVKEVIKLIILLPAKGDSGSQVPTKPKEGAENVRRFILEQSTYGSIYYLSRGTWR